ncbi:uncharacterized protein B0I36DRAFT_245776 [Microdochium trichocladiopsis]|uniref:LysM domain-containing protein n=1 Tax=Microdochium trichocladiopsis TaxID=1682393 RepID=A0A9P9BNZ9_9PEZI|nr:uncharacterized protein B0I36DRAFT_245776 [Microdochium trichocladiopsis]KAH7028764.1 hypothetical protein B0I36DRAFT_245776 [Microdochium trichocladiopsis]
MKSSVACLLATTLPFTWANPLVARQAFELDPKTTPYCTWYYDTAEGDDCQSVLSSWGVTMEQFRRWNPSIGANCGNFLPQHSYCIEASTTKPPSPSTSAATTTKSPGSTTTGANGVATPLPIREHMTTNCRRFYKVNKGDTCEAIITAAGIYGPNFYIWNPDVMQDCSGLWADTYVCLQNVAGPSITLKPTTSTTTTPTGNGVVTPTPFQVGMTSNCRRFYYVQKGDTCQAIINAAGIYGPNFYIWNPAVKEDCSGLWANTYACIGNKEGPSVTIRPPTPTPTKTAGNGVATPTPIQPGMVSNCKSFYLVEKGDTCSNVAAARGITVANFIKWNPAVGTNCAGMWADTWACVGLI